MGGIIHIYHMIYDTYILKSIDIDPLYITFMAFLQSRRNVTYRSLG